MKRPFPVIFDFQTVETKDGPLVIWTIHEGFQTEVYEMDADEAITAGTRLLSAAHQARKMAK